MKAFLQILLIAALTSLLQFESISQVRVKGYYRKDGTYVRPHVRSNPDGNPYNNWSYPGNTNPYTGKVATGNPDAYLRNYYGNGSSSSGIVHVDGYYRSDGTYVQPHWRTSPDGNLYNNWSYSGTQSPINNQTSRSDLFAKEYDNNSNYKTATELMGYHLSPNNPKPNPNYRKTPVEIIRPRRVTTSSTHSKSGTDNSIDYHYKYPLSKRKLIEASLDYLGYIPGNVDGTFTAKTIQAIKDYQISNGLVSDGKVGQTTFQSLLSDASE